jgi:hypothetical protein
VARVTLGYIVPVRQGVVQKFSSGSVEKGSSGRVVAYGSCMEDAALAMSVCLYILSGMSSMSRMVKYLCCIVITSKSEVIS